MSKSVQSIKIHAIAYTDNTAMYVVCFKNLKFCNKHNIFDIKFWVNFLDASHRLVIKLVSLPVSLAIRYCTIHSY